MAEDFREIGSVRPEHGKQGSIQIPYPKFDLGKTLLRRQFTGPIRTVYATIDRGGTQSARSFPSRHNSSNWMDWSRR